MSITRMFENHFLANTASREYTKVFHYDSLSFDDKIDLNEEADRTIPTNLQCKLTARGGIDRSLERDRRILIGRVRTERRDACVRAERTANDHREASILSRTAIALSVDSDT